MPPQGTYSIPRGKKKIKNNHKKNKKNQSENQKAKKKNAVLLSHLPLTIIYVPGISSNFLLWIDIAGRFIIISFTMVANVSRSLASGFELVGGMVGGVDREGDREANIGDDQEGDREANIGSSRIL